MDGVLILVLVLVPILATFAYASVSGAPWVPTWRRDVERFLKLAQLKPGERFYDLGCGDGRLVTAAARAGATAVGYECSILPYILARLRCAFQRSACILYRDFWNADLSDADVVYCFLMPAVYPRLKAKLERECKSGTRVILYVWPMKGWAVDTMDVTPGQPKLYRHIIKGFLPLG
jgi:SAM-dependent methyltransferase